jgi:hypothetical protein
MYIVDRKTIYRISSNKRPPQALVRPKNEKWELIAFLLNNFFKKSDRKINAPGRLLEEIRYIGIIKQIIPYEKKHFWRLGKLIRKEAIREPRAGQPSSFGGGVAEISESEELLFNFLPLLYTFSYVCIYSDNRMIKTAMRNVVLEEELLLVKV